MMKFKYHLPFALILAMLLSVVSCKEDIKIELTPSCLISLSNLETDAVIKKLTADGWTRHKGIYTDYTYSKSGIHGKIELIEEKNLSEKVVWFTTESDILYEQWYVDLEKMGYRFKDVSEFRGLKELCGETESKNAPKIMLIISDSYSDETLTNLIGHTYSMYIEPISNNHDK